MQNFNYCTPTRLIFGEGVIKDLPEVMSHYGKKFFLLMVVAVSRRLAYMIRF